MDISIFLAKVLGLYLLIIALAMLVNAKNIRALLAESNNTSFVFLTGTIALIIGVLLVVTHNIWEADWKVLITILGWLTLIKGIVRLFFPEYVLRMTARFVQNSRAYFVIDVILLIVGIYLSYVGFAS